MSKETRELKDRIVHLSDEELVKMVTVDSRDYRQDAIEHAKAELRTRGVDLANPSTEENTSALEEESDQESASPPPIDINACTVCGVRGKIRSGTLVAEKELTIIFGGGEERFVKVHACTQCGHVSLVADFETDVQQ
ncbi:MAG TPA: hypothetical protein VE422_06710 [Terriglobia bacterium]|nr:hypothetical protein [Terriglobia bacterium]